MKIFVCPACGADLFFDNLHCACGHSVVYDPLAGTFIADVPACANREVISCNWRSAAAASRCLSCAMTTVHPDLAVIGNDLLWSRAEHAKRWVLAGLLRWGWFGARDAGPRPRFQMLAERTSAGVSNVMMGHESGLVTINLAEANAAERVRRRDELGEPYRTLIGHFRHEIAHVLFDRLAVEASGFTDAFRALFGDETQSYPDALARHYGMGPPPDWQQLHVTSYASAHPHEDWAESAAHAMHLSDLVDSFLAAGLQAPGLDNPRYDAFVETDPDRLFSAALSLGIALNHVNRSMGQPDLYPFVNAPQVRRKLGFAQHWLRRGVDA